MVRRALRGMIGGLALAFANCLVVEPAAAIDVRCIEASKYKYLWLMFDGNPNKLAEFLGVSAARLPEPEMCRAVLVTGFVGRFPKADLTHADVIRGLDKVHADLIRDLDKLLGVVAQNEGWLVNIYLASPGGDGLMGMLLGQLTRLLWLKTNTVDGQMFEYFPDFGVLPFPGTGSASGRAAARAPEPVEGLAAGWKAYLAATRRLSRISVPRPGEMCVGMLVRACRRDRSPGNRICASRQDASAGAPTARDLQDGAGGRARR